MMVKPRDLLFILKTGKTFYRTIQGLILFFSLLLATNFCLAQNNDSIIGKWELYAVMDDEYYHNFDTDSIALSAYYKEQLVEQKKDTIKAY